MNTSPTERSTKRTRKALRIVGAIFLAAGICANTFLGGALALHNLGGTGGYWYSSQTWESLALTGFLGACSLMVGTLFLLVSTDKQH